MVEITNDELQTILTEAIDALYIPHFMQLGMNASGKWKDTVEARGNEIWGQDYTEFLANGRGANHDQSPEAIKAWVGWAARSWIPVWLKDKGLNLNPYAVAQNIARKGTKRGSSDLLDFLNSRDFLDFVGERIAELLAINIQKDLFIQANLAFR